MKQLAASGLYRITFLSLSLLITATAWSGQHLRAQDSDSQKEQYKNVKDALQSRGKLNGDGGPSNVNWIEGGDRYSYTDRNSDNDSKEIWAYDPSTDEKERIFTTHDVTFPDSDSAFTYRSFQWSKDSEHILFRSNFRPVYRRSGISDYYLYSLDDESLRLVVEDARTAELAPDGSKVAYERDAEMFVYNLGDGEETQLTNSSGENIYNGRFGWVYEEEFGLAQAWQWSPDSKHIAFWRTDESEVPIFKMTDYQGTHIKYEKIPYPQVGDTNPDVRIGVINVNNGDLEWMDVDGTKGYIPRIYWTSNPEKLGVVHLNRAQRHMRLFFSDINSGDSRLVMEEKRTDGWVDIYAFFNNIDHLFIFPKDKEQFFWMSDRNGWTHLYRYDYNGDLINKVTDGKWEVTKVHEVDPSTNTIFFNSTRKSPLERHLYSINFDGSGLQQHTRKAGSHSIDLSPNTQYYIDRYSNTTTPRQVELWNSDGEMLKKLVNNQQVSEFIDEHFYAHKELFSFETDDGQQLDAQIIKPPNFDSTKKHPLFLNVYGGPGHQKVENSFHTSPWIHSLVQEGFVVAGINNRGSGGYGRDFEKIVYKQLGKWEAHDFVALAEHLSEKSWIDADKTVIRGHSYGGYMVTYAMSTHPDVFEAGLVGAPVTDWRLYDSIYTERYMGLLSNNKEGYLQSASTTHADSLKGQIFLAHSAKDENVHVRNTFQFVKALTDAGIDADLRIYPPGAHGVSYNRTSYYLLYETYTKHLNRYLGLNLGIN